MRKFRASAQPLRGLPGAKWSGERAVPGHPAGVWGGAEAASSVGRTSRPARRRAVRPCQFRIAALVALSLGAPGLAQAARLVVIPATVGSAPEPAGDLLSALAAGLAHSGPWVVTYGPGLQALFAAPVGLKDDEHGRLAAKRDAAAAKIQDAAPEAVTAAEELRKEIAAAARGQTFSDKDWNLLYRTAGTLVAALLAAGNSERAAVVAQETALTFPGRKPADGDDLPEAAATQLAAATVSEGPKITFKTQPAACQVYVNGVLVGPAPAEVWALAGESYQAHAVCGELRSHPKRVVVGEKETARQELLDAEFEKAFAADGGARLRIASAAQRREGEDVSARRVAERYDADVVVFVSVGELGGADWLNARLYLRSGYLNRQGLVRLEPARAAALGRYLASGKETPGVLKPEEAGALLAASQSGPPPPAKAAPWYTDIVGWCFTGAGLIGVGLGLHASAVADRTSAEADAIRGDSEKQSRLHRDAQRTEFFANIGMVGGGLMAVTGVVLLAIPQYSGSGETFALTPIPGGATLGLRGRF